MLTFESDTEMYRYCADNAGEDGLCSCSTACSGASYSNLACDHEPDARVEGYVHYRGGNYGSCHFLVRETIPQRSNGRTK